jgi:peptide methionine sulfoxide reductase msrA/msrB
MIRKNQGAPRGLSRVAKLLLGACAVLLLGVHCRGEKKVNPVALPPGEALATFAGGCFWCMEPPFEALPGVREVLSGYTGGHVADPSYDEVCSGETGHLEAVQVRFDPAQLSYDSLLAVFWRNIDPTDAWGQFADKGSQYRTAIFCHTPEQRAAAQASKEALAASGVFERPIVTEIRDAAPFYPAEDYHQDYHLKQPQRYQGYKEGSGRAGFLRRLWGGGH